MTTVLLEYIYYLYLYYGMLKFNENYIYSQNEKESYILIKRFVIAGNP